MNPTELEKRYRAKIRIWYERFEALSDITDKLHNTLEKQKIEIETQRKLVEKVVCENCLVMKELQELQREKEKMEFSHVELEK